MRLAAILVTAAAALAGEGPVRLSSNPHWLEFRSRPALLVGDSVTQGWMELGANFDQTAYIDALARRGVNAMLLWAFIGITSQAADERIGYDAPEIWPWPRRDGRFDLRAANQAYFDRLRELVSYAGAKGIAVVITVHDGWTKTKFDGHPFNAANGGPLEDKSQYVELHDFAREMPLVEQPGWTRRERHQHFLERFCDRLIQAVANRPNVMFEMFNEGEWYEQKSLRAFQVHFLEYFRKRTPGLLLVNADHVRGPGFRSERNLDAISHHKPRWDDLPGAGVFFRHYAGEFEGSPTRPILFTESAPEFNGEAGREGAILRLLWGTALAGAGVLFQNNTSWGFDPRSAMARHRRTRDRILDLEGHLARFLNSPEIDLPAMRPDGGLASTGVCLARPGFEYIVYVQEDQAPCTVSLPAAKFAVRWWDPGAGKERRAGVVSGGPSTRFTPPFRGDSVLHLKRAD